jgi:hypothetical protein
VAQVRLCPLAILAAIVVAREKEGIRHLPPEPAGYVHKPNQPDDRGSWDVQSLAPDDVITLRLDNLRLPIDHQSEGSPDRN